MNRFLLIFIVGVLVGVLECRLTKADTASPGIWQRRASVNWTGTTLGESLTRFTNAQKMGLLIDRRIDPSISLQFEATNQPLEQILRQLAESLGLGCVLFDSTVYFGPQDAAEILPALLTRNRKQIESLPPRRITMFRRKMSPVIPFLSEPGEILQNLAAQNSLHWKNLETLPHDLWDKKSLVGLTLDELLTILLIGFEMTFDTENGGETLVLVPLQKSLVVSVTISTNEVSVPDSSTVPATSKVPFFQRRFTLKVEEQRLDVLLQSLAKRLDRTLELDEESLAQKGVTRDSRISFDVKNATAAQLFQAILRPLKLDFRIKDDSIRVW